jgi:hypothetical protein
MRIISCAAAAGAIALAGCGGSSKPSYCTDRTNLENSIKQLSSLNLKNGVSGLKSQLQSNLTAIQTQAQSLVNSAEADFPNETVAIQSSVGSLTNSLDAAKSNPSVGTVASVVSNAEKVASSVKSFTEASSSACK